MHVNYWRSNKISNNYVHIKEGKDLKLSNIKQSILHELHFERFRSDNF